MSIILAMTSEISGNVTTKYPDPIKLDKNVKYEIALHTANLWYSWSNVDSSFGNNIIKYNNGVDPVDKQSHSLLEITESQI
jgi:hypothetical protein